jgi:hypothetical protein
MTDRPCPFCHSTDTTRSSLYVDEGTELIAADDIGEVETVHCRRCLGEAPVEFWNRDPWRYPPDMPEDGQRVLHTYEHPECEMGPIISTYNAELQAAHCYPIVRWMPIPEVNSDE